MKGLDETNTGSQVRIWRISISMNVNIARLRRNVKKINVKEKNAILGFVKRVGISTIKIHKKEHEKYRVIIIGVHIAVAGHSTKQNRKIKQRLYL